MGGDQFNGVFLCEGLRLGPLYFGGSAGAVYASVRPVDETCIAGHGGSPIPNKIAWVARQHKTSVSNLSGKTLPHPGQGA